MKDIRIEKVTLNMGCGTKLKPEIAKSLLERITGSKAVIINTRKRTTFNVPSGMPIGCKVTIRKRREELLKRLLEAVDKKLKPSCFDATGNFSFGIKEYIDIPGMEYDPSISILGLDVCVTLERPGFCIKRKKISRKIGKAHAITRDEAMAFMKEKFGAAID